MNINSTDTHIFKCKDLALAGTLYLWFPLLDLDISNVKQVYFCFQDSKDLRDTVNSYWNGSLLIEPKSYFQSIKLLKSRIYQG